MPMIWAAIYWLRIWALSTMCIGLGPREVSVPAYNNAAHLAAKAQRVRGHIGSSGYMAAAARLIALFGLLEADADAAGPTAHFPKVALPSVPCCHASHTKQCTPALVLPFRPDTVL